MPSPGAGSVGLAVFDLDGTLTRRDTLLPFVAGFVGRHPWRLAGFLAFLPAVGAFALGSIGRGTLKSALIRCTLGGVRRDSIEHWKRQFVPRLMAHGLLAEAVATLERRRQERARLVLLSASTDLYVPAIGAALGFHETICTGVGWKGDRLDGRLTTSNRRGEEKARCLEALRARYPGVRTAAYGNARSDLAHLRMVEEPLLVNAPRRARAEAEAAGIPCAVWN